MSAAERIHAAAYAKRYATCTCGEPLYTSDPDACQRGTCDDCTKPLAQLEAALAHLLAVGLRCGCATCQRNRVLLTEAEAQTEWAAAVDALRRGIAALQGDDADDQERDAWRNSHADLGVSAGVRS